MVLFEIESLGPAFASLRYGLSLAGIFWIAWAVERLLGPRGRQKQREPFSENEIFPS